MPPSEGQDEGRASLEALDKVIADKPHKVGNDFSAATRHLCAFRDELIGQFRAARDEETHPVRERLSRVNAVISTVLAGHFPLGPIPWPEIEKAREQLREAVLPK
jgi:formate dehydrogenase major subunit